MNKYDFNQLSIFVENEFEVENVVCTLDDAIRHISTQSRNHIQVEEIAGMIDCLYELRNSFKNLKALPK